MSTVPRRETHFREAAEALSGPVALRRLVFILAGLYALLPLAGTALYSFATVWRRRPLPDGYTLYWWQATLADAGFLNALQRSLLLAVLTVIIVNLLVLPALYWSHVRNHRIQAVLTALALIPFVLPGIVMASGIHRFVGLSTLTAPLQATPELLLAAFVATSFPPYLWAVDNAMRTAGVTQLCDAAETLGAGPLFTLLRVVLPSIAIGVLLGSLLVFASAFGELALARLITGNAYETLPLWQLRTAKGTDANPNAVAASSLVALGLLFLVSVLIVWLGRPRRRAPSTGDAAQGSV